MATFAAQRDDDEHGGVRRPSSTPRRRSFSTSSTFLADLPAGRSLEGYIRPDTYNFQIAGKNATPRFVVRQLLTEFERALEPTRSAAGIRRRG